MEVGMEMGFSKDRILLSASFFRNRSYDQLSGYAVAETAGPGGNLVINQPAVIQNAGWEFLLNTTNLKGKNFKWTSSFNVSIMRNKKIKDFPSPTAPAGAQNPSLGQPFYGTVTVPVFAGVDPATGQYQFEGLNGHPTFDPFSATNKQIIRIIPEYTGGFVNSITFKGFSLSTFLQFTKQTGYNYIYQFNIPGVKSNQPIDVLDRWKKPGDVSQIQRSVALGLVNPVPEVSLPAAFLGAKNSSIGYVDASFIRLKNVSFSYNIPDTWNKKIKLKNARIYVLGQNLLTITNYKGTDPETQNSMGMPPLRVITAGFQSTL